MCFIMTGLICYIAFGDINNGSITAELGHRTNNHVLNFLNLLIAVAVGKCPAAHTAVQCSQRETARERERASESERVCARVREGEVGVPSKAGVLAGCMLTRAHCADDVIAFQG